MAKQFIFNQQSDTSLNDESSDEIDFGVNILDNELEKINKVKLLQENSYLPSSVKLAKFSETCQVQ